jgi:hypothetical protein
MKKSAGAADGVERPDPLLEEAEASARKMDLELERGVQGILDVIRQYYPPLRRVDSLELSLDSMRGWLKQHQPGGVL